MSGQKCIKVVNVTAKTINLAKTMNRVPPCRPIPPPPATPIRVCTPEQLRSICPPKPCVCPEPPVPLTGGEKFLKLCIFVSKTLFLVGFIKWTDMLGIWGDIDCTSELVCNAYKKLSPALGGDEEEVGDAESGSGSKSSPPGYGITYNVCTMWNRAVTNLFWVVGVLPVAACSKMFHLVNSPNDEEPPKEVVPVEPPPPPPKGKK